MRNRNGLIAAVVVILTVVLIAYIYSGEINGDKKDKVRNQEVISTEIATGEEQEKEPEENETEESEVITESAKIEETQESSGSDTEETNSGDAADDSYNVDKTSDVSAQDTIYENSEYYYKVIVPKEFQVSESHDLGDNDVTWGKIYIDESGATLSIEGGWNECETVASVEEFAYGYQGTIIRGKGDWYCLYTYCDGGLVHMVGYYIHSEMVVCYDFTYDSECYEERYQNIIESLENYMKAGEGIVG